MRKIFLPLFCLLLASPLQAAPGWIGDTLFVPVRSGPGNEYRILHRGLKTGTPVEVLEMEEGSEWTRIRYGEVEGYVNTQYVSRSPTASLRLERAEQSRAQAREQLTAAQQKLKEVTQERDRLAAENSELQARLGNRNEQLENLKEVAADPIRLDQANRKLNEELSQLRTQLDTLQAENTMLRGENTSGKWLTGALILIAGALFGWLFKGRSGRGRSSWV